MNEGRGVVSKAWLITWWLLGLFWLLGTIGFLNVTPLRNAWASVWPAVMIVADLSFVVMGLMTIRDRLDWWVIGLFLAVCAASMIFNHQSVVFVLNGMRIYSGGVFLLPVCRWLFSRRERAAYFINKLDKSLYVFLWLQWPAMLYEYAVWGGGDYGGGTLGNLCSGLISSLIYVISFYLMQRRWRKDLNYGANLLANLDLIFLLGPTVLNETKISFVFVLLYFLLLLPIDRKFVRNLIYVLPVALLLFAGVVYAYVHFTNGGEDILDPEYFEYYVFGDDDLVNMVEIIYDQGFDEEEHDFQRGIKLSMLPAIIDDVPHGPWVGYGVSQFKGGSTLERSDFFENYEWLINGTQLEVMNVIIDMGLIGLAWFIFYTVVFFGFVGGKGRANRNMRIMMLIMWILMSFYTVTTASQIYIMVFTILAVLSWNWNRVDEYEEIIAGNRRMLTNSTQNRNEGPDRK